MMPLRKSIRLLEDQAEEALWNDDMTEFTRLSFILKSKRELLAYGEEWDVPF